MPFSVAATHCQLKLPTVYIERCDYPVIIMYTVHIQQLLSQSILLTQHSAISTPLTPVRHDRSHTDAPSLLLAHSLILLAYHEPLTQYVEKILIEHRIKYVALICAN